MTVASKHTMSQSKCKPTQLTKPLLPFLGTKRHHLQFIADNLPPKWDKDKHRYIEPFLGSGVVFQYIDPKRAVVSDASPYLMCMYKCLKEDHVKFVKTLTRLYQANSQVLHDQCKVQIMKDTDPYERAAMFAYLQKTSLYSFACPRMDKTAFRGAYKNVGKSCGQPIPLDESAWTNFALRVRQPDVDLIETDFEATMDMAKTGDFLFLDPPYIGTGTRVYLKFTKDDHARLMQKIAEVSKRGVHVMMFNHAGLDLSGNPELTSTAFTIARPQSRFGNYVEHVYTNY